MPWTCVWMHPCLSVDMCGDMRVDMCMDCIDMTIYRGNVNGGQHRY